MIGQQLHPFYASVAGQLFRQSPELVRIQGIAGHQHMPDPYLLAGLFAVIQSGKGVFVGFSGQRPAILRVNVLDVQQKHVRQINGMPGLGQGNGAAGVNGGVEALLPAKRQQILTECRLHQRLSAGKGHASPQQKAALTADLLHYLGRRHAQSLLLLPGIWIVTVQAPEGTAGQKYHKADAGAVHCAEAFQGMQIAGGHGDSSFRDYIRVWKVRWITSSCCSRVSLMKLTA